MNFEINRRKALSVAGALGVSSLGASALSIANALGGETALSQIVATQDDAASAETAKPKKVESQPLPFFDRLGLQLYTVRNQMAENPAATLKAVAEAGYQQVELISIDNDALELAKIARDEGLMVHSAFLDWRCITMPGNQDSFTVDQTIDMAERIGLRHVVFGYIGRDNRDTVDKCKQITERANDAARKARAVGLRMAYHNHSFEFDKLAGSDQSAFDLFIDGFDPQLMDFELDVFWAKLGGRDPIQLMKRLAGRITMLHLKDLKEGTPVIYDEGKVPKEAFQECGDGIIDLVEVMRLAREIGVLECHVEQDQSPAPLKSIAQSYQFFQQESS